MHLLLLLDGFTRVMSVPNLVAVSININIIVGKVVILHGKKWFMYFVERLSKLLKFRTVVK